jgi:hypothetical protein
MARIDWHRVRLSGVGGIGLTLFAASLVPAAAADISPHRALYAMTLQTAKSGSGVIGAGGAMAYEWGETCDGWTVQQRFRLRVNYDDSDPVDLDSTLVSWESKDGLRYRFNERRMRNGDVEEEVKGEAHLDGPGKGGQVEFVKPQPQTMTLDPGVLFPTAHTILLIDRAKTGENFISRYVFDGATVDNAGQITAVIGPGLAPGAAPGKDFAGGKEKPIASPLLQHPSWRMRLAFFPTDVKSEEPDYELSMRLFDDGVSSEMLLDYVDYVVRADLRGIEALPKPGC